MAYGNLKDNTNAEKWTLERATSFMYEALELSISKDNEDYKYDFIGEIARDLNQYKEIFSYLSDKYEILKPIFKQIRSNCEANCFYNGKKGKINTALAIVNLKANHNWTDRIESNVNQSTTITWEEEKTYEAND